MGKEQLFDTKFLKNLPRINNKGKEACRQYISRNGMVDFCLQGYALIELGNTVLHRKLEELTRDLAKRNPDFHEEVERTVPYAAGFLYHTLFHQASCEGKSLPVVTEGSLQSLTHDWSVVDRPGDGTFQALGDFLVKFDSELAAIVGGFLAYENPIWKEKVLSSRIAYYAIYMTYVALLQQETSEEFARSIGK